MKTIATLQKYLQLNIYCLPSWRFESVEEYAYMYKKWEDSMQTVIWSLFIEKLN